MKIQKIDRELSNILQELTDQEHQINEAISTVHEDYKLSAKNLYRYLILRSYDLRKYHDKLSDLGLSSLRTTEGYVYSNLFNVVKNLKLIQNLPFLPESQCELIGYKKSKKLLKRHANSLFNETRKKHFTEIMVTLTKDYAENKKAIKELALNGMEIARIDLSHGDKATWTKLVQSIHEVKAEIKQEIKIYMDLSGPRIRTSHIEIQDRKALTKDSIQVRTGEHIILTNRDTLGKKSRFGSENEQIEKAEIGVQLDEIIKDTRVGDVVLFDNGMIHAKIIAKRADELELVLTNCYKPTLSSKKGINLPNTELSLEALTNADIQNLSFVAQYADIVGYSFVKTGEDVRKLYRELDKYDAQNLGVVFKIENKEAFQNLPEILITGMEHHNIGVMIARGDLAVDIGFERISEVQNQILWLCEAAHIPVIWATQVLENLTNTGIPTRAEISDAALGAQAECVMLNKGPHLNEAVKVLKDILIRMEGHSFKKKNSLRSLNVAKRYLQR